MDLTQVGNDLTVIGCVVLFIVWLLCSRRMLGFLYGLIGCAILLAIRQSSGDIPTLERSVSGILICGVLALIIYGAMQARRRRRVPAYAPVVRKDNGRR